MDHPAGSKTFDERAPFGVRVPMLLLAAMLAFAGPRPAVGDPRDMLVVRVHDLDRAGIDALAEEADLWAVVPAKNLAVFGADPTLAAAWRARGLRVVVDVDQTAQLSRLGQPLRGQTSGIPGFPCYRTVEETHAAAAALAAAHPTLASWIDIGDSWEKQNVPPAGYDLRVLVLTNQAIPGPKPILFYNGGIHAREYTTPEMGMRFAEHALAQYETDPDLTWILDHHEIHLQLQANPDGRKRAETGLSWRKNADNDFCANTNNRGIDLNRNFLFQWGCCGGSSGSACSGIFRGPGAASEPETAATQNYLASIFPDQRPDDITVPAANDATGIMLDVHSFGGDVLWSWGFTTTQPPNGAALYALGRKYAFFTRYRPQHGSLSTVDGSTKDFAYGVLGVPGFTIELGTSFFESCASFENVILPDNLRALTAIAKYVRTPYVTAQGPDAIDVVTDPQVGEPGSTLVVRAILDDTRYGTRNGIEPSQPIAGGDAFVDVPSWSGAPAPSPIPLAATDGAFDATVEAVDGVIDTTGMALGRHTVFVEGDDTLGHRGAPSAAFFWVLDPAVSPTLRGRVLDAATAIPVDGTVDAAPFSTDTDPGTGDYELLVASGTYDLHATADGYRPATVAGVMAADLETVVTDLYLTPLVRLLADDVENGNIGWTAQPPWAIDQQHSNSPTHAWTDSPGGNYASNRNVALTSPAIDATRFAGAALRFWHRYELEEGFDYGIVELQIGAGPWTEITRFTGDSAGWRVVERPLPTLDGETGRIRFRLTSDSGVVDDGWYLDDIEIAAADPTLAGVLFADGFEDGDTTRWSTSVP